MVAPSSRPNRVARRTASAAMSTAISGAAGAWATPAGRGQDFRSHRQADRLHLAARTLRQPLLRRPQTQPSVHGREPFALFALCEHARRAGWLTKPADIPVEQSVKFDLVVNLTTVKALGVTILDKL